MSPEEIIDAYNVVAKDVQDRAANEAARIGNAQRSLGPLAARVASPSGQTYGLANYTYDRTMRPVVDTTVSGLVTTGYGAALDSNLKASLRAAKNRYEDAKNRYTVASSTSGNNNNNNDNKNGSDEVTDKSFTGGLGSKREYGQYEYERLLNQYQNGEISEEEWEKRRSEIDWNNSGAEEARQRQELYNYFLEQYRNGAISKEDWERIKIGL